jgi:hypothetical protein
MYRRRYVELQGRSLKNKRRRVSPARRKMALTRRRKNLRCSSRRRAKRAEREKVFASRLAGRKTRLGRRIRKYRNASPRARLLAKARKGRKERITSRAEIRYKTRKIAVGSLHSLGLKKRRRQRKRFFRIKTKQNVNYHRRR